MWVDEYLYKDFKSNQTWILKKKKGSKNSNVKKRKI